MYVHIVHTHIIDAKYIYIISLFTAKNKNCSEYILCMCIHTYKIFLLKKKTYVSFVTNRYKDYSIVANIYKYIKLLRIFEKRKKKKNNG